VSNAGARSHHGRNWSTILSGIDRFTSRSIKLHMSLIAGTVAFAAGAATFYLALRPEAYTASSSILIENGVVATSQSVPSPYFGQQMQNQYQIFSSDVVLKTVIRELDLLREPDFAAPPARIARATITPASAPTPGNFQDDGLAMGLALDTLRKRIAVERIGNSSVFQIHATAGDPRQATNIANRIASVYLADQAASAARMLSAASEPQRPDGPNAFVFVALAGLGGLTAGLATAFVQEAASRKITTPAMLRAACGLECFGVLPVVETRNAPRVVWPFKAKEYADVASGFVNRVASLEWAVERPCSLFAHTLRRARAAALRTSDPAPATVVLGVTSAMPREGKTIVAANLARIAAASGKRVLLIDAVPYNYQLSKLLAANAQRFRCERQAGAESADVVLRDPITRMHFLPGCSKAPAGEARAISDALFAAIRAYYELIIVDLPPLLPVSDVLELAPLIDKVVLVIEWRRWTGGELESALNACSPIREKLIGTVLNKAAPKVLRRFATDIELAAGGAYADYVNDQRSFLTRQSFESRISREFPHQQAPQRRETAALHLWRGRNARDATPGRRDGNNDNA
jgi:polysaccharide biosynthesis transport protein